MSEHVRLIENYIRLVREGNKDKAQEALKAYWDYKQGLSGQKVIKKIVPEPLVEKEIKIVTTERTLDSLVEIKGIGKETVEDIKSIYKDFKTLVDALVSGINIPLRNDVVKKLRKNLL